MDRVKNKVAIITGGASDLGKSSAVLSGKCRGALSKLAVLLVFILLGRRLQCVDISACGRGFTLLY